MTKENKLHIIRPEDLLALLMILPSIWVTSPSEYYYLFNGNIIVSKHMTALMLLFLFAILTALYENRIQRIVDTIKSGVKIPAVTIQDQAVYLWKTKFRILQVIRDYLPFLICIIAYNKLTEILPHVTGYSVDKLFMAIDLAVVEGFRLKILGWLGRYEEFKNFLSIAYKTYFLGVPILATYLYMLKEFKRFREFLLAIVLGSAISIIATIFLPSKGLGCVSLPAIYTAIILFFSFTFNKTLATFYIPIACLFFIAEILSYSDYLLAIVISIIIGMIVLPLARLIQGAWS